MTRNRQERRALKRNAAANAVKLARCCFDYNGKDMLPVTDPVAVAVLERTFTRMLEAGGQPMALPISEAEAMAFPFHRGQVRIIPNGVTWIAVGMDVSGRGSYSIQCAHDENRALAHEAARAMALSRLRASLGEAGFPAWSGKVQSHA